MKADRIRARLDEATREQLLVRLSRSIKDSDQLDGFVVGHGSEWLLLALVGTGIEFDGHVAVRLGDLSKVELRRDSFARQVLAARGQWPPASAEVDLDTAEGLVRSAADLQPLVTLHIEAIDPDVCFIGRPVRFTKRSVRLLEITPRAVWEAQPTKCRFRVITRVDFGSGYEDALAMIGGAPPA